MIQAITQTIQAVGLVLLGIILGGAGMFIWLSFTNRLK
ncbi:hypothetical protein LCGC14_0305830 [marine sediment metagenome]|uniref:Uncharacterized protein n=1 Tax=marine sediment metagenome TaxID=412755 RepID=A0A0F9TTW1_9ZZZZ